MSTTVFDQNFLIGSATGDGYVVRVWAEQEDGAVFWYAQATTQYYDGYIDHYDPDTHQAYRADAGTAASYINTACRCVIFIGQFYLSTTPELQGNHQATGC